MLFWYGVNLGLRSLVHGHLSREVVKSLLVPANYWRTLEFRLVTEALCPSRSDLILDVGSPKLLSLYYAHRLGTRVVSTDIEPYFLRDYRRFQEILGIPEEQFRAMEADGRHLPFGQNQFTKIFSVSVLEHIPGDGDSECMRELARTLSPGGRCAITVPFSPAARDEFLPAEKFYWSGASVPGDTPETMFFQRWYDDEALERRLIKPSGLTVARKIYFGERIRMNGTRQLGNYFPPHIGPLHPLLSRLFHCTAEGTWQRLPSPLGVLLVFVKP